MDGRILAIKNGLKEAGLLCQVHLYIIM
jgi:hypothetical protein